jgi:asparagine synthase (glutamine-hydrolysing)
MCGIAGIFLAKPTLEAGQLTSIAQRMGDAIISRGPDDGGVWVDPRNGIGLAHRRLSIIDLSPEGHQPMVSASGRFVISFNGEIYNYRELRAQLQYPWRGQSDTEVMLAAFEAWGIEKALAAFNGMFAFAVWDKKENTLTLARDRMGEKPLYYGWVGDSFVFGSELKAFRDIAGWAPPINRDAINLLMRFSYIPAPHSIYQGINKLMPATYLTLKAGQKELTPVAYWSFEAMVEACSNNRITCSVEEAADELDTRMRFAVSQRMMADVPLGVFLSGGIDSSSIVALMQQQSSIPVRSFTIGFTEQGFDEAPYARAIARHLQTEHTEIYVSSREAAKVIEHLPQIYDEPFADSSQIPTHLVSKFARQHVTVALSGDGGDEMFGGYNRYVRGPAIWKTISMMPLGARMMAAKALMAAHGAIMPSSPHLATTRAERMARKLRNYYDKIATQSPEEFYVKLCSIDDHPERVVIGGNRLELLSGSKDFGLDYGEWMMMQDALTYFPGDILTKVDRAAMAVGLETRTPFTDPEIMGFAWQLPMHMKIHQGKGKWLLRQVLYRYVPPHLIERPKAGFSVPIGSWLRGRLKPWASDLLSPEKLRREGFFDATEVQNMWDLHQTGRRDKESQLWNVLMFQSWLDSVRNN